MFNFFLNYYNMTNFIKYKDLIYIHCFGPLAPLLINDQTISYGHNKGNMVSKLKDSNLK